MGDSDPPDPNGSRFDQRRAFSEILQDSPSMKFLVLLNQSCVQAAGVISPAAFLSGLKQGPAIP